MDGIGQVLLSQGPMGAIAFALMLALAFQYRDAKATEAKHESATVKQEERHAIEIAAERQLNAALQNERLTEMKEYTRAIGDALRTVETASKGFSAAVDMISRGKVTTR